jgi:hypothetical protein
VGKNVFFDKHFLIFWWLQGERKMPVLIGISVAFALHVVGVYWWYQNDDLMYPLVMLPPKEIPPFWHAIFIIMVNGVFLLPIYWLCFSLHILVCLFFLFYFWESQCFSFSLQLTCC